MLKSMTGYGRLAKETSKGSYLFELQSVNRKNLEISLYLPRELSGLEIACRKALSEYLSRGQILLRITREGDAKEERKIPELDLVKRLKKRYDDLAHDLGYKETPPLTYILEKAERLAAGEDSRPDEEFAREVLAGVEAVCLEILTMKKREGSHLEEEMFTLLKSAEKAVCEIETSYESCEERIREQLLERYRKFIGETSDEERIIKEAFLLAERSVIREEITRLRSHFGQFKTLCGAKKVSVGKELDFLIIEMHREINTILAKSVDIAIKNRALEAKSIVEKMREQVQNVE